MRALMYGGLALSAFIFFSASVGSAQQTIRGCEIKPRTGCAGGDLSGQNLLKAELAGADLSNANLSGADLKRVELTYTNLTGVTWVDGRTCAEGSSGDCK